jgi:WD40 repeat protein
MTKNANSPRIFISYANSDGAASARALRLKLEAAGFAIWQDIVSLEGGRDWWTQIEEAIRAPSVEHVVLVMSREALDRPIVRREIRLAKTLGKQATPVRAGPEVELGDLPRWIGHILDPSIPEHWERLVLALKGPSQQKRVPMMAPEPPVDFVPRPKELEALRRQILDPRGDATAIIAALRGAGGYGKTTLAKALAYDADVLDAYFDGVLWVELGQEGSGRVIALISDLVTLITGTPPAIATREAAREVLANALGDRRILLVIDDVWHRLHLEPFLHGGANTTRLITTRFDRELPDDAQRLVIDAMTQGEALTLLSWGLPPAEMALCKADLQKLSDRLGEMPQLLKLANGFLRGRVMGHSQPLQRVLVDASDRYQARGLSAFVRVKADDYEARHQSFAAVIDTTLELLEPIQRERFGELGLFPEDAAIPVGIVALLWRETGGLDSLATDDLLQEFYNLSLLLDLDFHMRTVRLHDTTRHFLQDQMGAARLAAQHKRLLLAIKDIAKGQQSDPGATRYFYEHRLQHLAAAGELETVRSLLLDANWLQAKLTTTRVPQQLIDDYLAFGTDPAHSLLRRTLELTAGILVKNPEQFPVQVTGRLSTDDAPKLSTVIAECRKLFSNPTLAVRNPTLTAPGGEVRRLRGHSDWVTCVSKLDDLRSVSGSLDGTIRVWNYQTGKELRRIATSSAVTAVACLDVDRMLSAAWGSLTLWDLDKGAALRHFSGHNGSVKAIAKLDDMHVISGSFDRTLRIWSIATGEEVCQLNGHKREILAVEVLSPTRVLSGSADGVLLLWDITLGTPIVSVKAHKAPILGILAIDERTVITASADNTLRIWNPESGHLVGQLDGHLDWVRAVVRISDNLIASASFDRTVRVWNLKEFKEQRRLDGHADWLTAISRLDDTHAITASDDKSLIVWDLEAGAMPRPPSKHSARVNSLLQLDASRIISAADDGTVRLWAIRTGRNLQLPIVEDLFWVQRRVYTMAALGRALLTAQSGRLPKTVSWLWRRVSSMTALGRARVLFVFDTHTQEFWDLDAKKKLRDYDLGSSDLVLGLAAVDEHRVLAACNDRTVRFWDLKTNIELQRFVGHNGIVTCVRPVDPIHFLSASSDATLRLWRYDSKVPIRTFDGHAGLITSIELINKTTALTSSYDGTVRVWDLLTGERFRFDAHEGRVHALASIGGRRILSGGEDGTLRLWDLSGGAELARLDTDSSITVLAKAGCDHLILAGDALGRLHWLNVIE